MESACVTSAGTRALVATLSDAQRGHVRSLSPPFASKSASQDSALVLLCFSLCFSLSLSLSLSGSCPGAALLSLGHALLGASSSSSTGDARRVGVAEGSLLRPGGGDLGCPVRTPNGRWLHPVECRRHARGGSAGLLRRMIGGITPKLSTTEDETELRRSARTCEQTSASAIGMRLVGEMKRHRDTEPRRPNITEHAVQSSRIHRQAVRS